MKYNTSVIKGLLFSAIFVATGCSMEEGNNNVKFKNEKSGEKEEEMHIVIRLVGDNLLENKEVEGTGGRLATGLSYHVTNKLYPDVYMRALKESGGGWFPVLPSRKSDSSSQWTIYSLGSDANRYSAINRGVVEGGTYNCMAAIRSDYPPEDNTIMSPDITYAQGKIPTWSFLYKDDISMISSSTNRIIYLPNGFIEDKTNMPTASYDISNITPNMQWNFIPYNFELKDIQIKDLIYDEAIYHLEDIAKNTKNVSWDYYNYAHDGQPDEYTLTKREEIQNFTSWEFTNTSERTFYEKINWGTEGGVSINIFGIYAGVKGHYDKTTEWSTKDTSITNKKEVHMDDTVMEIQQKVYVRPRKKVEVRLAWFTVDVELPYTATVYVKAKVDRMKQSGSFVNEYADGPGVKSILMYLQSKLGGKVEFAGFDGEHVKTKIYGRVGVSGATRGEVYKYEYDLPNEKDPVSIEKIG